MRFNGQKTESPDHFRGCNDRVILQMAATDVPMPIVCCVSTGPLRASPGINIARKQVRGSLTRAAIMIPGEARRA